MEEIEEEVRSRRGTFSGEGQLLNFEDEPTIEGFVMMKGLHIRTTASACVTYRTYNR